MLEHVPEILSHADNLMFVKEILEEEIQKVVFSFNLDKIPRLDRISAHFYHQFWEVIKYDFCSNVLGAGKSV